METVRHFAVPSQTETQSRSAPLSAVKGAAIIIARYLLDFLMTMGGLNAFLDLACHPLATLLLARQYMEDMLNYSYMVRVVCLQGIAGLLLLANHFVLMELPMLAALKFNILFCLASLEAEGSGAAIVFGLVSVAMFMARRTSLCELLKV